MAHLKSIITSLRRRFFSLSFYPLHIRYFVVTILISSIIIYCSGGNEQAHFRLRYIDALFLCASAMTCTGMNTVNLSSLTAFQQAVLFVLILAGNLTVVSVTTVVVRRHFLKVTMRDIKLKAAQTVFNRNDPQITEEVASAGSSHDRDSIMQRSSQHETYQRVNISPHYQRIPSMESGEINLSRPKPGSSGRFQVQSSLAGPIENNRHDYLSFLLSLKNKVSPIVSSGHIWTDFQQEGFNSLTELEREELGGVEYRALSLLMWPLPAYILFWLALPMIVLVPYSYSVTVESVLQGQPGNLEPAW